MSKLINEEIKKILKEQEEEVSLFEENPLEFILGKYPSLLDVMEELMTESFRDYVTGIFVVAPKPTTFKVLLHNGHFFFLTYNPKGYQAKISGKRYQLVNLQDHEHATKAIATLLMLGMPPSSEGPDMEETNELEQKDEFIDDLTAEPSAGGEEEEEEEEELQEKSVPKKFKIVR